MTNLGPIASSANSQQIQTNIATNSERISSGKQINSAKDDAAGLAIATGLSSESAGNQVAQKNIADGISMLQTRDGALQSISKNISRMSELSLSANNGIYNDSDRSLLDKEFQALKDEINTIVSDSNFNGQALFSEQNQQLQTGSEAGQITELAGADLVSLLKDTSFSELSIANQSGLQQATQALGSISEGLSEFQAETGASINVLASQSERLADQIINTESSRSRIEDADIAKEISNLSQNDIKNQVDIALQGQANANQKSVLALLSIS